MIWQELTRCGNIEQAGLVQSWSKVTLTVRCPSVPTDDEQIQKHGVRGHRNNNRSTHNRVLIGRLAITLRN